MKKLVILLFLAILAFAGWKGYSWYADNRMSNFTGKAHLYLTPGCTTSDAISQLGQQLEIRDLQRLERVFAEKQVSTYIKPGHYVVKSGHSSVYVARMLNNGWQAPVNLTLSGSLRLRDEIAGKIGSQLMVDSSEVRKALDDEVLLGKLGYTPRNVFALFIPDTYETYWNATIEEIFTRQKQVSDAFWTEDNLKKAQKQGLSRMQVCTLASIVRSESNYQPEFSKIAGVYLNRYRKGMPLQADPTVAYCYDYKINRVLNKHLEYDSPYNTYKYSGLPPGPICVPSRETLEAVLNPDLGGGNLYFCANADFSGKHVFAKTLAEHNRNAHAFQEELNRRAAAKRAAK